MIHFFRSSELRADRQFLPAALEILETPPSPIHMALLLSICTFAIVALSWSYFGRIDIIAIAQGKLQPAGRVKIIQPLETGKVIALHAENGKSVEEGQILVELDASDARADEAALRASLASFKAEIERRRLALEAARRKILSPAPEMTFADDIPERIRLREQRVLSGDLGALAAAIASLDAQITQKEAERERLGTTIAAQHNLLATLGERVSMRTILEQKAVSSRANVIDATESMQYQLIILATQQGQLAEAMASLNVLGHDREKLVETFVAENSVKLQEAERQWDETQQKHRKATAHLDHMILRSPIKGIVTSQSISTLGQVVTVSQELMRIVPEGSALEIECYLPNKDIGFVRPGQDAVVKIESFPFTHYGTVNAKVLRVAHDAIPEADAQQNESDPAHSPKASSFGGGQRIQNLVFPVTLALEAQVKNADGIDVPLSPGMAVSVEIRTGERRILEYIFAPLVEVAASALKER